MVSPKLILLIGTAASSLPSFEDSQPGLQPKRYQWAGVVKTFWNKDGCYWYKYKPATDQMTAQEPYMLHVVYFIYSILHYKPIRREYSAAPLYCKPFDRLLRVYMHTIPQGSIRILPGVKHSCTECLVISVLMRCFGAPSCRSSPQRPSQRLPYSDPRPAAEIPLCTPHTVIPSRTLCSDTICPLLHFRLVKWSYESLQLRDKREWNHNLTLNLGAYGNYIKIEKTICMFQPSGLLSEV